MFDSRVWNITLNQLLDTSGYLHENNVKNREYVKDQMTEKKWVDVWRICNDIKFDYAWGHEHKITGL